MYTLVTILIILICALIILVVLIQNSKGGGFASGFAGTSQVLGVRKSADFLERLTWGLAGGLFVVCLLANFALPKKGETAGSTELKDKIEHSSAPATGLPPQQAPKPAPAPEKK